MKPEEVHYHYAFAVAHGNKVQAEQLREAGTRKRDPHLALLDSISALSHGDRLTANVLFWQEYMPAIQQAQEEKREGRLRRLLRGEAV